MQFYNTHIIYICWKFANDLPSINGDMPLDVLTYKCC